MLGFSQASNLLRELEHSAQDGHIKYSSQLDSVMELTLAKAITYNN